MKLNNTQLLTFIDNIKLSSESMPKYRKQIDHLKEKLSSTIKSDDRTDIRVTKFLLAGSWKKRTILRPTGENPIDIDLILFVESKEDIQSDLTKLHDYLVDYLGKIYPQKDIHRELDAEKNTKSIKIKFSGSGLEVDIVPVVELDNPIDYVWQPERGGSGTYITSINKQLAFSLKRRQDNPSYTAIVRALKWWRNYKELSPTEYDSALSSFSIELIVAYLDITQGVESNIEEGLIRFFQFVSSSDFPVISFSNAINQIPAFSTPIYIAEDTNNENSVVKKLSTNMWNEVVEEADDAFDTLIYAQSRNNKGDTVGEWKRTFGPSFTIG